MKKILLIATILLGLFLPIGLHAEPLKIGETLDKLPPLKSGIAYSLIDSKINYLATLQLASWKNITLEAGYAGDAEKTNHKAVAVISYPLLKLKDLGVNVPILDLVEANIGLYAGFGRIQLNDIPNEGNNELDYGLSLTLLNIKW